jgi:heme exporter protein D
MNWASPSEFFAMGGYALYVWGSYAVTAACIAWELAALVHRTRAIRRALGARELKEAA